MKKLLLILLCLPLLFTTCKKEARNPSNGYNAPSTNNTSASIIGSWDFTEYHIMQAEGYYLGGYPNGTKIITASEDVIMLPGDASWGIQSVNWNFKSDGTIIETLVDEEVEDIDTYVWVKNGNTLTIDTNDIWSIVTLSSSKLTINSLNADTTTQYWDPNNDTVYFYEGNATIKWDRSSFIADNLSSKRIQSNKDSFFKTFIDRRKQ